MCRYFCYCSDITCSYPVSRVFSPDQRLVYETVLEAQKQILGMSISAAVQCKCHTLRLLF